MVKAFDLGIASMKRGEKSILTCAPDYAYGAAGSPPNIPPNSTLLFEVHQSHINCIALLFIALFIIALLIGRTVGLETGRH